MKITSNILRKMSQINFRVDDDIKDIIELISKNKGISVAELAKRATIKEISHLRIEIAFDLLSKGKIARKKAWKISGLSALEFLNEWTERGAEEKISEKVRDYESKLMREIDISKYKRKI